jgi:hypothetical protein
MAPFEALYGRRCRTPLNWVEARERRFYGNNLIAIDEENVRIIRQNMETKAKTADVSSRRFYVS